MACGQAEVDLHVRDEEFSLVFQFPHSITMLPRLEIEDASAGGRFGGPGGDVRLRDVTGWNWVDHPGLVDGVPRKIRHDGVPSGINLLYLQSLDSSVRLLRAYGQEGEAGRLEQVAALLREQLLAEHWDAGRGLFADCVVEGAPSPEASVHVNLLAIEAGLAADAGALLGRTCGPRVASSPER